jgi:hypothetical protein
MPRVRIRSWTTHRDRKQIQPRKERPRNPLSGSARGARPGEICSASRTAATEARYVWIPYQKIATTARMRAGRLAPKTPNGMRDSTGYGMPWRMPAMPVRFIRK